MIYKYLLYYTKIQISVLFFIYNINNDVSNFYMLLEVIVYILY